MLGGLGDRIRTWFSRPTRISESYNPDMFEALCLERPDVARALLRKDRTELAQSFEDAIAAYRERIAALEADLADGEDADPVEVVRIREILEALRGMVRRLEIALQSDREVEEELHEWEMRTGESGIRHADHPEKRAEVARSELALRGRVAGLCAISEEDSPFRPAFVPDQIADVDDDELRFGFDEEEDEERLHVDPQELTARIREATREMERWHAVPLPTQEACEATRHVRELHAILKRADREQGIERNRMAFAVRVR